jgi:Uma2 family endonuclease
MAATTTGPVTFAELEQLPETPGYRYELHRGELVKVAPPRNRHYRVQWRIFWLLVPIGRITGEVFVELGFRALPEHEYRQADVAFVSKDRWERSSPDGNLAGAPELVIEVLSPSNRKGEIPDKERLCLENGSLEFWIVDPIGRHVKVSTPDGRAVTYKSGEQIPLLFGGTLAVDSIFETV